MLQKQQDVQDQNQLINQALQQIKSQVGLLCQLTKQDSQKQEDNLPPTDEEIQNMSKDDLIFALKKQIVENENQKIFNKIQRDIEERFQKHILQMKNGLEKVEIFKIVITGGPYAGKTNTIISIAEKLREQGYSVYLVPESAQMMSQSGVDLNLSHYSESFRVKFQYYLLMLQLSLEDIIIGLATTNNQSQKIVLLSD